MPSTRRLKERADTETPSETPWLGITEKGNTKETPKETPIE